MQNHGVNIESLTQDHQFKQLFVQIKKKTIKPELILAERKEM